MPDGATYQLKIVTLLYGEAQGVSLYYVQSGADPVPPITPEDELIDSWQASGSEAAWQVAMSDQATIICYEAQQVLPTIGIADRQFVSIAGSEIGEALPPKSKAIRQKFAFDPGGNITRKSSSRNWWMGLPISGVVLGQITQSKYVELQSFQTQLRNFPGVTAASVFNEANITSRTVVPPAGQPLTSAPIEYDQFKPRVYNLRDDTLKLCGAA